MPLHPKTKAGVSAGAVATVIVTVLGLAGIVIPSDVTAAIVTLVVFAASWLAPGVVTE